METLKVGIIGATGYAGAELLRLLLTHPAVTVAAVSSKSFENQQMCEVYPNFLEIFDGVLCDEQTVVEKSEVVFASLPHGLSEPLAKACVQKGAKFIDLGADFRLSDPADYEQWYGLQYHEPELHQLSAYCIPELHRSRLAGKQIVGNPGCYPTSIALALAPVLQAGLYKGSIIVDSKSGATGAGRGLALNTHFPECNEAFSAYKIAAHRHTPEIEETLSGLAGELVTITFVPHLLPINRGILSTIYLQLQGAHTAEQLHQLVADFYREELFVRVLPLGRSVNLKYVRMSNYCDISVHFDSRTNRLILCSAIDNMVKGAAGQAIQNMNLLCGFAENTGLDMIPPAF